MRPNVPLITGTKRAASPTDAKQRKPEVYGASPKPTLRGPPAETTPSVGRPTAFATSPVPPAAKPSPTAANTASRLHPRSPRFATKISPSASPASVRAGSQGSTSNPQRPERTAHAAASAE